MMQSILHSIDRINVGMGLWRLRDGGYCAAMIENQERLENLGVLSRGLSSKVRRKNAKRDARGGPYLPDPGQRSYAR